MSKTRTIELSEPIKDHRGVIKKIVLHEPKYSDFIDLGMPTNDRDVLPIQRQRFVEFMRKNYPTTPVFGHGEVNPGHKEATEGLTVTEAVRADRARSASATTVGRGNPADFAESLENLHDHDPAGHAKIMKFLSAGGHGMDPATTDWCASFVSSALHQAGYRDIPQIREGYKGGDIANAYQTWGTPVEAKDVRRGDVVITTRGRRPGQEGGHISIATGPLDKDNEIPVIEGDTRAPDWGRGHPRHMVKRDWETPRPGLMFRRVIPPDQAPTREAEK